MKSEIVVSINWMRKPLSYPHASTQSVKGAGSLLTLVCQLVSDTHYELFSQHEIWDLLIRDWNIPSLSFFPSVLVFVHVVRPAIVKMISFHKLKDWRGETWTFLKDPSRTEPTQRQTTKRAFWGKTKTDMTF